MSNTLVVVVLQKLGDIVYEPFNKVIYHAIGRWPLNLPKYGTSVENSYIWIVTSGQTITINSFIRSDLFFIIRGLPPHEGGLPPSIWKMDRGIGVSSYFMTSFISIG